MRKLAAILLCLGTAALAQQDTSYFNRGFLRQPSAAADRAYLGITNGGGLGLTIDIAVLFGDGSTNVLRFTSGSLTDINPPANAVIADDLGNPIGDDQGNPMVIPL